jgi:hypothetical protein
MTGLRERPLRLEPSLTRDYVNRAVKMREIEERLQERRGWRPLVAWLWMLVLAVAAASVIVQY